MSVTDNKSLSEKKRHGFLKEVMSGSMLTDKIILKNLGFILFLSVLGALYIANRFHAEKLVRRGAVLQAEVKELRAEALATSAELNSASRQSEIIRLVRERGLGLEELTEPPYLLVVKR